MHGPLDNLRLAAMADAAQASENTGFQDAVEALRTLLPLVEAFVAQVEVVINSDEYARIFELPLVLKKLVGESAPPTVLVRLKPYKGPRFTAEKELLVQALKTLGRPPLTKDDGEDE